MASQTFTGIGWHEWVVPDNVIQVQIDLRGAGSQGREGGRVIGVADVQPGDVLQVLVGEGGRPASGNNGGETATGGGGHGGNGYAVYGGTPRRGGDGGGGCSAVRRNNTSGPVVAVAGGAGGRSGQSCLGGQGGAFTGGSGQKCTGDPGEIVDPPTGGTQSGRGQPGVNRLASVYNGEPGAGGVMALGGRGGQQQGSNTHGGGGGGGGYYPGGGGTAGNAARDWPSAGGGAGSNYIGGMFNATSYRGQGNPTIGLATLTWSTVFIPNVPPTPPTDVKINGLDEFDDLPTLALNTVTVEAEVNDPASREVVRLLVRLSPDNTFASFTDVYSRWVSAGERVGVVLNGLMANTHYYARLYTQDDDNVFSNEYNAVNFWTDRPPGPSELISPVENATIPVATDITFDWRFVDPDGDTDSQSGFRIRWRTADYIQDRTDPWFTLNFEGDPSSTTVIRAGNFVGNKFYEWQIQTADAAGIWGEWSLIQSWYSLGATSPPSAITPGNDSAAEVNKVIVFDWRFNDPTPADYQINADIRYRLAGQDEGQWITLFGQEDADGAATPALPPKGVYGHSGPADIPAGTDVSGNVTSGIPGTGTFWPLEANTLEEGHHYEWQVRTLDQTRNMSDWSASAFFWTVALIQVVDDPIVGSVQGALGCEEHRVFIFAQGGKTLIGEVTPVAALRYGRTRDDISNCLVTTNGFGVDCGAMLADVHCWMHEVVVFRGGMRVWEGPITRIAYKVNEVEIEAKDVMAYAYRRIMRQGYNDSYHIINGVQTGLETVVRRGKQILMNAMAPWDCNLLPFLTTMEFSDDARQSRVIPDYAKTAWEEVDDLAATAGLDYTTVGRRIILWDTHRPIGRLPELRDIDFNDPPIVTEYGMQLADYFAVTNGSGVWGAVTQKEGFSPYGPVELLASAYGETDTGDETVLTPDSKKALEAIFTSQANRGIQDRWPTPVVVRVPDNSALSAQTPVTLQQLVPGVWIPVRAMGTVRQLSQWQKLDSVTVEVTPEGEQIRVVMSPAPNGGRDPDAEETPEEDV